MIIYRFKPVPLAPNNVSNMSRNITIKNSRLLKSKVLVSNLIGDNNYILGYLDEFFRATDDESEACHSVLYDKKHIGRGVQLIGLNDKKTFRLSLSMPCTAEDVQMLYKTAERVASQWNAKSIIIDDEKVDVSELQKYVERDISQNISLLNNPSDYAHGGYVTLYCAICPICISAEQLISFGADYSSFSTYLNEKQQIDAFYSCPHYFKEEEALIAMYIIIEDGYFILPNHPKTTIGSAEGIKVCDQAIVAISELLHGESTSVMLYDDFVSLLPQNKKTVFDCQHILISPLTKEELIGVFSHE